MTATTLRRSSTLQRDFFLMSNAFARNAAITPRACKVYIYLASHMDGWEISVVSLTKQLQMSKETVTRALQDLEDYGYLVRERKRKNGRLAGWEYEILDQPVATAHNKLAGQAPYPKKQDMAENGPSPDSGGTSPTSINLSDDESAGNAGKDTETAGRHHILENRIKKNRMQEKQPHKKTIFQENNLEEHHLPAGAGSDFAAVDDSQGVDTATGLPLDFDQAPEPAPNLPVTAENFPTADPDPTPPATDPITAAAEILEAELVEPDPAPSAEMALIQVAPTPTPAPAKRTRRSPAKKSKVAPKHEYTPEFNTFWTVYPGYKEEKTTCFETWLEIVHVHRVDPMELIDGAQKFALFHRVKGTDRTYIWRPLRWLRSRGWEDEQITDFSGMRINRRVLDEAYNQQYTQQQAQQPVNGDYFTHEGAVPHLPAVQQAQPAPEPMDFSGTEWNI